VPPSTDNSELAHWSLGTGGSDRKPMGDWTIGQFVVLVSEARSLGSGFRMKISGDHSSRANGYGRRIRMPIFLRKLRVRRDLVCFWQHLEMKPFPTTTGNFYREDKSKGHPRPVPSLKITYGSVT
jgi:hypothetical protein